MLVLLCRAGELVYTEEEFGLPGWGTLELKEAGRTVCCSGRPAMPIHGGGRAISAPSSPNGSTTTSEVRISWEHISSMIHVDSAITPGSSQSPFFSKNMLKACFMCSFSFSILMTFCYSEWEAGFSELFLFFLQAWMISSKRKQIYGRYTVCNLCRIVPRTFGF